MQRLLEGGTCFELDVKWDDANLRVALIWLFDAWRLLEEIWYLRPIVEIIVAENRGIFFTSIQPIISSHAKYLNKHFFLLIFKKKLIIIQHNLFINLLIYLSLHLFNFWRKKKMLMS